MIDSQLARTSSINILKDPSFRKAFCMKPQFNYDSMKPYCEEIVFVTDGYRTKLTEIAEQIDSNMKDFDPDLDCIVPTGTAVTNIFIGFYLCQKFPLSSVAIAFFQKATTLRGKDLPEDYRFYRIYIDNLLSGLYSIGKV